MEHISPFLGTTFPYHEFPVTSTLGFKSQDGSLNYTFSDLHAMDSSDSPPSATPTDLLVASIPSHLVPHMQTAVGGQVN